MKADRPSAAELPSPGGGPVAPDAPVAETPPPRRRRRWLRRLFLSALLAAAVLLLGAAVLLQDQRVGLLLGDQLGAALGTSVSLDFERRGLRHWELRNVEVGGDSLGRPFLQAARIGFYPRPGFMLEKRLRLDSLVVAGLTLNLSWQDSLLLPAWLDLANEAGEDSSMADPLRHLRLLADRGWVVDSTRLILRDLRLTLAGHQGGRPLDLASPTFGLDLRLPRLEPNALREVAAGRVPPQLLAGMLLGWSGPWQDAAPGLDLRPLPLPPGLRQALAATGLDMARGPDLLQQIDLRLDLVRDTLHLGASLDLRPRDLILNWEGRATPLPERFRTSVELAWPVRENPLRADAVLDLLLVGEGLATDGRLEAALRQVEDGWEAQADWSQRLALDLDRLGELGRALELPPLGGTLELELGGTLRLTLSEDFGTGQGAWEEVLRLTAARLELPAAGLAAEGLVLRQELRGDLELAHPLPRQPRLELSASLERLLLAQPPFDDPQGLELRLVVAGSGPRDSLELAADLSVASWQGGRIDLSANGRLPSLADWAEDLAAWQEQPQRFQDLPLRLDLETSRLSLDGLDPSLGGGLRVAAQVEAGHGLRFQLEAIPGDLQLDAAGRRLDLPLHRLEISGGARLGDLFAPVPWPDTLWAELRPEPLPALQLRLGRTADGARLKVDWTRLDLPRLIALLPLEWRPSGVSVEAATAGGAADLHLGRQGEPLGGELRLTVAGGRLRVPGWLADDVGGEAVCQLDTLGADWSLDLQLASLQMADPAWSWEGFSLAGAGRLDLPLSLALGDSLWLEPGRGGALAAGGDLRLGLASLDLAGLVSVRLDDWRGTRPDLVTMELGLGGRRLLRPWPGLQMGGRVNLTQRLERRPDGLYAVVGDLVCRIDSLDWRQEARVTELALDLPFTQVFALEPAFALASDRRRQPVDWNSLRGWDRRQPDFEADPQRRAALRQGRGWPLRIARVRYGEWSMEALSADLRIGQGRLDLPEFRFTLLGGGVRGAMELVGLDNTSYALDCSLIGLDSRHFEFGGGAGGGGAAQGLVNAVLHLEGAGLDLRSLDQLRGQLRMPDLDRQVTLNLLRALDAQGVDPSIGKVRRLLELPGFRYRVERVDFDVAHGFARPRVSLRKSPFSPLPDVAIPMSPLPLGFMIRNFALAEEETP
ncbi:MAG: hypothetical protein Q8O14_00835 [bacterium]|nr:hypothetical protein [bacterium]